MNESLLISAFDGRVPAELACDYILPDTFPDIKRILRVAASPVLIGRYAAGKRLEWNGALDYLVTFSADYADEVEAAIAKHLEDSTRADITSASLDDQGLIVVCTALDQAMGAVNIIAPEHLELHIANPLDSLGAIRHAGAIFLGEWTPEAVGDYVAGPNHTLPTGGTARFSSPLSVEQFVKKSSIIQYSQAALNADAPAIIAIAKHEGLWAHARSVELRMRL